MQLDTPEYCYILDMCALPETRRCGLQDYLRTYYYLLVSNPLGVPVTPVSWKADIMSSYCIAIALCFNVPFESMPDLLERSTVNGSW